MRHHKITSVVLLFLASLTLSACAEVVGAGVGGYAGSQLGKGNGKTAATVGGAAIGAGVGHVLSR